MRAGALLFCTDNPTLASEADRQYSGLADARVCGAFEAGLAAVIDIFKNGNVIPVIGEKIKGIFTIGGGVPRNWAQQLGPYLEILSKRLEEKVAGRRASYDDALVHAQQMAISAVEGIFCTSY